MQKDKLASDTDFVSDKSLFRVLSSVLGLIRGFLIIGVDGLRGLNSSLAIGGHYRGLELAFLQQIPWISLLAASFGLRGRTLIVAILHDLH